MYSEVNACPKAATTLLFAQVLKPNFFSRTLPDSFDYSSFLSSSTVSSAKGRINANSAILGTSYDLPAMASPPRPPPLRPAPGRLFDRDEVVGHPFRAINTTQNFQGNNPAPHNGPSPIRLVTGDVGKVVDYDERRNSFRVININQPASMNQGWVNGQDIEISEAVTGQPDTIIENPLVLPQIKDIRVPHQLSSSSDQISSAINGFFVAVDGEKARSLAPIVPAWWIELTGQNGQHIGALTRMIVEGTEKARTKNIFNKPDFKWTDFLAGREIKTNSHHGVGGIYIRIYWEIEGEPGAVYIYIGQAIDFSNRFSGHRRATWNENDSLYNTVHYQIARKAKKMKSVPICILEGERNHWRVRSAAEQAFMCLLGSYRDYITHFIFETTQDNILAAAKEFASSFTYKETAQLLLTLTTAVMEKTGWPGACTRPSFATPETEVSGLNISSPIKDPETSHGVRERTLWIMTRGSSPEIGQVINFRKSTPQQARFSVNDHGTYVFSIQGTDSFGTPRHLKFVFCEGEGGPPDGATIQIVFEFMGDPSKAHPRSYARAPTVGGFHDWKYANSFAFRCEWNDPDGKTNIAYLQRKPELSTEFTVDQFPHSGTGSLCSYAWGIALWRYFNRVIPTNLHDWDINFGVARVREITVDYFEQIVRFSRELGAATGTPPSNERRTRERMAQEMEALGLTGARANRWRAFPPGANKAATAGRSRTKCDTCTLFSGLSKAGKCEQMPGTNDCKICITFFGRPCSWTHSSLLQPDASDGRGQERRDALMWLPLHDMGTEAMDLDTRTWAPPIADDAETDLE
ncbi:hypothetical protein BFW01_g662 [Lasiodiplodia theobromae]|nr:hypothetical protein BFW01_g662 [Lasiodiplodia theobromae]